MRESRTRLYVLGDSISMHYGVHLERYISETMDYRRKEEDSETNLGLENPRGANGGDSSHVLRFLTAAVESGTFDADILLLNAGLHDIRRDVETDATQIPIQRYRANLTAIVSVASRIPTQLVWVRTTPCHKTAESSVSNGAYRRNEDCIRYNEAADRIMHDAAVPIVDLYRVTLLFGDDLYRDHVHFHDGIAEKQAIYIAGRLAAFK